jgi:hypothetical protein
MKLSKKVAPLTLAMAVVSGAALAAEPVPAAAAPVGSLDQAVTEIEAAMAPEQNASKIALIDDRMGAVGLGAIAGVVVFNLATGGVSGVPMMASLGAEAGAGMGMGMGRGMVAMSRVYAVTSAVAGGLVGDYLYRSAQTGRVPAVPAEVASRVAP